MNHFSSIQELELETCINGSLYCLMSVPHLKDKAKNMGLREVLEERLKRCENEQVIVQIKHIFAKMDEEIHPEEENSRQAWKKQQYVIDETDKEDDLDDEDEDD